MSHILCKYYEAMNKHEMNDILKYIDDNVHVTFPEVERNWKGIQNVDAKFGGMFERMPTFHAAYKITHMEIDDEKDIEYIYTNCQFTCNATSSNSSRDMVYLIKDDKIIEIRHL